MSETLKIHSSSVLIAGEGVKDSLHLLFWRGEVMAFAEH